MISQWDVLKRLRQLIPIEDDETENTLPICITNLNKIKAKLRTDADRDDIRITEAAAAMSYYDYGIRLSSSEDNITSFKAGDVTISRSNQSLLEHATNMKTEALREIIPLLADTQFVFSQVGM